MAKLITDAAAEPVSLTDFKTNAKVDGSSEDTIIATYIAAARKHFEQMTGQALITQTWEVYFDKPPVWVYLPKSPIQSITSIKYIDTAGDEQTLATTEYTTDLNSETPRIKITGRPSVATDTLNTLTVRFVAGYGDASTDVPSDIIQAVLYMATHFYEHRTPVAQGTVVNEVPITFEALYKPHVYYTMV